MSLDIQLYSEEKKITICYCCGQEYEEQETIYDANITHNLTDMAIEAGVYEALWQPNEIGKIRAGEIVNLLDKGLKELRSKPVHYKQFNSKNGWGKYQDLIEFIDEYLQKCIEHPDAIIKVSR